MTSVSASAGINPPRSRWVEYLIPILLAAVLLYPFGNDIEGRRVHGDENWHFVISSHFFSLFFLERDFDSPLWENDWAFDQPMGGRYLYGSLLWLEGGRERVNEMMRFPMWRFNQSHTWNEKTGRVPPKEALVYARSCLAAVGLSACILFYFIGRIVSGRLAGIAAALLLGFNELMLSYSKRVMSDGPLLFFTGAALLGTLFFVVACRNNQRVRAWMLSVTVGLCVAASASIKLNGGLAGVFFAFVILYMGIAEACFGGRDMPRSSARMERTVSFFRRLLYPVRYGLLAGVVALVGFFAISPNFYHEPLKGVPRMVAWRKSVVEAQRTPKNSLADRDKKVNLVWERVFWPSRKNRSTLTQAFNFPVELIFAVAGLAGIAFREWRHLRTHGVPSLGSIAMLWCLIVFFGVAFWIPLTWPRYFLPLFPPVILLSALGFQDLINGGRCVCDAVMGRGKVDGRISLR